MTVLLSMDGYPLAFNARLLQVDRHDSIQFPLHSQSPSKSAVAGALSPQFHGRAVTLMANAKHRLVSKNRNPGFAAKITLGAATTCLDGCLVVAQVQSTVGHDEDQV